MGRKRCKMGNRVTKESVNCNFIQHRIFGGSNKKGFRVSHTNITKFIHPISSHHNINKKPPGQRNTIFLNTKRYGNGVGGEVREEGEQASKSRPVLHKLWIGKDQYLLFGFFPPANGNSLFL